MPTLDFPPIRKNEKQKTNPTLNLTPPAEPIPKRCFIDGSATSAAAAASKEE